MERCVELRIGGREGGRVSVEGDCANAMVQRVRFVSGKVS